MELPPKGIPRFVSRPSRLLSLEAFASGGGLALSPLIPPPVLFVSHVARGEINLRLARRSVAPGNIASFG